MSFRLHAGKVRLGCLPIALSLFALAAFPAGATALSSHPFLGSFCEPTGLGSAPCEPSFGVPAGMAIDPATGDLLVIDAVEVRP